MNASTLIQRHAAVICLGVLAALALLGTGSYLAQGRLNSGDLYQHHAAGTLWKTGLRHELYRGDLLGLRVDAWQQQRFPGSGAAPRDHFNYLYPPLCAVLAGKLSRFSFETWSWIWLAASLVLLGTAWHFCQKTFPGASTSPVTVLAVLAFPPLHYTLYIGQITAATLALGAAACLLLDRRRSFWAGFVLAALFYKPQLLPWVGWFMLLTGRWRFIGGMILGGLFWLGLGLATAGLPAHLDWLACLADMAGGRQSTQPGVNIALRGMLETATGGPGARLNPVSLIVGLAGMAWGAWSFRKSPAAASDAHALAWALALGLVFSPYVCHYDYLLALPWMMATAARTGAGAGFLLHLLVWLAGLLSIAGLLAGWPYAGVLLAAWLFLTRNQEPIRITRGPRGLSG